VSADRGYPRFVLATFLDADWTPIAERTDTIPATQNGMGILSYLKYHELRGRREPAYVQTARSMGDYLVRESLTPSGGKYPAFTRSTGKRDQFPLAEDCGSQADRPHEIEPDKGGIAGYALALLSAFGADEMYAWGRHCRTRGFSRSISRTATRPGHPGRFGSTIAAASPRTCFGNMTYILRLYDALLAQGYEEFSVPRRSLWAWIKQHQIPNAAADGSLFAQFFEDHDTPTNRTAWAR
jgi:hypothetical protein